MEALWQLQLWLGLHKMVLRRNYKLFPSSPKSRKAKWHKLKFLELGGPLEVIYLVSTQYKDPPLPKPPCNQSPPLKYSVLPYKADFWVTFCSEKVFFIVKQKSDFLDLPPLSSILSLEATWNRSVLCEDDNFYVLPSSPFSTLLWAEQPFFFPSTLPHLVTCFREICGQKVRILTSQGACCEFHFSLKLSQRDDA